MSATETPQPISDRTSTDPVTDAATGPTAAQLAAAACRPGAAAVAHLDPAGLNAVFFPTRSKGGSNHGKEAAAICAGCPIREACLEAAVARGEPAGIWGGAGEPRRRVLRRALREGRYGRVADAHFRVLDGCPQPTDRFMLRAFGAAAGHGHRETYGRGCRCEPCSLAASFGSVAA